MSIGGLYFGMMRDGALKVEDLELVTLLPKRDSFAADLHEILDFVKDDLNALVEGLSLSSRYCYFPNHQFNFFFYLVSGVQINGVDSDSDFTMQAVLSVVMGDLQGLPEVYETRAPNANDVGPPPSNSSRSNSLNLCLIQACGYCDKDRAEWAEFEVIEDKQLKNAATLRERAKQYHDRLKHARTKKAVTDLQKELTVKGEWQVFFLLMFPLFSSLSPPPQSAP